MKKVANFLGEDYLRDCDSNEFYIRHDEIREAVGDRPVLRAIHFFNEEHNVKNAVSSLENGKFVEFLDAIRKFGRYFLNNWFCRIFKVNVNHSSD